MKNRLNQNNNAVKCPARDRVGLDYMDVFVGGQETGYSFKANLFKLKHTNIQSA